MAYTEGGTSEVTKRFFAALLALVLLAAAGCSKPKATDPQGGGAQADPSTPVEGGTLNLSMFSPPKGVFNPVLYEDQYDAWILDLAFNGLLRLNEKLEYVCDLCEKFDIAPDNKTVTFELRSGLKWHDGQPLTTADVAFTFRTMLHPDYPGVRTGDYAALMGVQKMLDERDALAKQVKENKLTAEDAAKQKKGTWEAWLSGDGKKAINVIDDKKIAFATEEPYAPFLQNLAYNIIPEHAFKGVDVAKMAEADATRKPIGTGPYKVLEYKTDQYVKLERNENFHLGKPKIATIIYKIVNQDVAIGQLKAGEIDFMKIKPADVELVQGDKGIKVDERADFGYQYMGINFDNPILKDKNVRQALMYSLNRKAMVDQLLKGHGAVVNSHMPPALWAYDASSLNPYNYDPKKASELLAAAGWKDKNAQGYLSKDTKVLEFTLKYPSGNKTREASAPLIQANLKEVGIKVNLQMMEFTTLSTTVFDRRDMDAWLAGWTLTVDPDPGSIFLPDNKWGKATGWTNQRNEELIKQGVKFLRPTERKPLYVEWAKTLNDELPYVFLYSQNDIDAYRSDKVYGVKPDARSALTYTWNIHEWWIPKGKQS
jgi:peptide/nickel transport system substrate-binding protein